MRSKQSQALSVLIVSTLAFTVCFMVWMMFGVIGIPLKKQLGLNATEFGLLTAMPVLTGSLVRVPLGIWTDRYGGRIVMAVLMACTVPAIWLMAYATQYWQFLVIGLFVGLAGGMESMSNAPHLVFARKGIKYGAATLFDHMAMDGLEDAYERGKAMGVFAETCVEQYGFSRAAQDEFAIASTTRAKAANEEGGFGWEIAPVSLPGKGGATVVTRDEQPFKARLDKIAGLKPAFRKDGTITAANASSISDGAAALVLMRQSSAARLGVQPLARIVAHAVHAQAPALFTTAPVGAIRKVLELAGWEVGDVDLWEVNEAFAAVTMAAMHDLQLAHDIVNVHGGACALGHPIGASGARIVVTLLGALRQRSLERGVAALCIGGGEATALALEML